jgi:hypothetical protein
MERRGDFLWNPEQKEAPIRDRSQLKSASRKLDLIPSEEINTALREVIRLALSIPREEAISALLALLGFKRPNPATKEGVAKFLLAGLEQGFLEEREGRLRIRDDSESNPD